jgi:hypothetical protein
MEKILFWLINTLKDFISQRSKSKKDVHFLAINIVFALDKYVAGCVEVVGDDGLFCGQRDADGCLRTQVSVPTFDLGFPATELKLLPRQLMYGIMNFPNDIANSNAWINGASEHAFPPDYEEAFEERQYQYAKLGIMALKLASDLRALANLPAKNSDDWEAASYFEEQKTAIDALREKRRAVNSKMFREMRGNT